MTERADGIRVGLALGGGAARGLAHLGVLRTLAEARVPVDAIAGTSMGALIGALYARRPDPRHVAARVLAVLSSRDFRRVRLECARALRAGQGRSSLRGVLDHVRRRVLRHRVLTRPGFLSRERYARYVDAFIGDGRIEDAAIPFAAVATDLRSGEEVVITRGSMCLAVAASCAIPGILPPIPLDGRLLADGGWVDQVPVGPASMLGADLVIGVAIGVPVREPEGLPRTGLEGAIRASAITRATLCRLQLARADVVVRPATEGIHWADFRRAEEVIRLGEEAARRALPAIDAALARGYGRRGRAGVRRPTEGPQALAQSFLQEL